MSPQPHLVLHHVAPQTHGAFVLSLRERLQDGARLLTYFGQVVADGEVELTALLQDANGLHALREDVLLINTSRGPVVDNAALLESLAARPRMRAVLDVWEPEPEYDPRLLARCLVGTPHIAGYAADGKIRGMLHVHEALCAVFGVIGRAGHSSPLAGVLPNTLGSWQEAVLACYDLRADDARLRASLIADPTQRGRAFDRLRRDYPARREFSAWRLGDTPEPLRLDLLAAGFSP